MGFFILTHVLSKAVSAEKSIISCEKGSVELIKPEEEGEWGSE